VSNWCWWYSVVPQLRKSCADAGTIANKAIKADARIDFTFIIYLLLVELQISKTELVKN
jgi:hypothetical protein